MKKIFLILLISISILSRISAQSISSSDFAGHWTSSETSVEMVIWSDDKGAYQMVCWDKSDAEVLEVSNLRVSNLTMTVTLKTNSTNFVINCTLNLTDAYNMKETIGSTTETSSTTVSWKKIKCSE
jgi:hypothetical protein